MVAILHCGKCGRVLGSLFDDVKEAEIRIKCPQCDGGFEIQIRNRRIVDVK